MFKKIIIALFSLVALIGIVGLILPKEYTVEREIIIEKPKHIVFEQIKSVKNHNDWSPWVKLDPNLKLEYKGEDGKVGFISSWSGNKNVGVGEQEIKSINEGERVDLELRFKEPMVDTAQTYFITESIDENKTKLTWGMHGKSPFPINIFCFLMNMEGMIGKDYETGLNSLKELLEKNP